VRTCLVVFSVALVACYPTLPPHLAEGTEVLRPGGASVTLVGGGAGFDANCCAGASSPTSASTVGGGGFETRVRVGIGAKQEVGGAVFLGLGTASGGGDPPFAAGGELSYKIAPLPWFAVVVDGGALDHAVASVAVAGGDLALIFAPFIAENGSQVYAALKGSFAVPFLNGARDVNEALEVPIGVSLHLSKRVRFIAEGGPVLGFAQLVTDEAPASQNVTSVGGYGVLAFQFVVH